MLTSFTVSRGCVTISVQFTNDNHNQVQVYYHFGISSSIDLPFWYIAQYSKVLVMFYDEFKKKCDSIGKSPSKVANEMGLSSVMVTHWKQRGNVPSTNVLKKICDYFQCDVADFFPATKKDPTDKGEIISEIDSIFQTLSPDQQEQALAFLKFLQGNGDK